MRQHISTQTHRSNQRGVVAVELAIVTTAMLLIVAGAVGFGRAYWYADALVKATRDGARLMTTWTFSASVSPLGVSGGIGPAQTITLTSANAANVSPQLTASNVLVECLDASFAVVNCNVTAQRPANVRVSITGFAINLSEWMPFVGGQAFGTVNFAPATTMRYMN